MVAEVVVAGQALSCFVGFVSGENRTLHIDLSMFVECCRDLSGLSYNAVSAPGEAPYCRNILGFDGTYGHFQDSLSNENSRRLALL